MSLNKVFLVGNLGHTPELKTSRKGKPFCRVSIATNDRVLGPDGDSQDKTTWHSVHIFGKQAEWVCSRLVKGSKVFVEARIEKSIEEGEEGEKKTQHFLKAYQLTAFTPAPRTSLHDSHEAEGLLVTNA